MAVTEMDSTDQYERILAILQVMDQPAGLLVWCNSQAVRFRVNTWLIAKGVHAEQGLLNEKLPESFHCLLLAPENAYTLTNNSHWVRDPFVWKWNQSNTLTLLGSTCAKSEDSLWASTQFRHLKPAGIEAVIWKSQSISVSGGNLLFDDNFALAGSKQFRASVTQFDYASCSQQLLSALNGSGRQFQQLIEIGLDAPLEPSHLAHLDLYLSLTGRQEKNKYVLLLGKCVLLAPTTSPKSDPVPQLNQMNEYLDAVEQQLIAAGFCIKRNPIPVLQSPDTAQCYICAYNNCLTQVTDNEKSIVWLAQLSFGQESYPHYSQLKTLEDQNIDLWKNLDFEVRLVAANFHSILNDYGALHCITSEILRS